MIANPILACFGATNWRGVHRRPPCYDEDPGRLRLKRNRLRGNQTRRTAGGGGRDGELVHGRGVANGAAPGGGELRGVREKRRRGHHPRREVHVPLSCRGGAPPHGTHKEKDGAVRRQAVTRG